MLFCPRSSVVGSCKFKCLNGWWWFTDSPPWNPENPVVHHNLLCVCSLPRWLEPCLLLVGMILYYLPFLIIVFILNSHYINSHFCWLTDRTWYFIYRLVNRYNFLSVISILYLIINPIINPDLWVCCMPPIFRPLPTQPQVGANPALFCSGLERLLVWRGSKGAGCSKFSRTPQSWMTWYWNWLIHINSFNNDGAMAK